MYDLTHSITDGMQTYPGDPSVRVTQATEMETDGYRTTDLQCRSHTGTHVDAPAHTEPDGTSLDAVPIGRFTGDAVRIDCRDVEAREAIPPERVPDADADFAIFWTGWDDHWGTDRYLDHPYLAGETAQLCARRGYDVGVDTINPDPTPSENARPDEPDGLPVHHVLLGDGQLIVENLTGLERLPEGFELRAYPLALGGDGAPVRAVGVPDA